MYRSADYTHRYVTSSCLLCPPAPRPALLTTNLLLFSFGGGGCRAEEEEELHIQLPPPLFFFFFFFVSLDREMPRLKRSDGYGTFWAFGGGGTVCIKRGDSIQVGVGEGGGEYKVITEEGTPPGL